MAVSERIKAEARRTIDGMQKFYEKYSDDVDDAEELEHRVARVEAAMEGCNGLSQEEKIQKTAENLFELTCSQERTYDAMRCELKLTREAYKNEMVKMGERFSNEIKELKISLQDEFKTVLTKIEDSGSDSAAQPLLLPSKPTETASGSPGAQGGLTGLLTKIISDHPGFSFATFIFILILVLISGHFDEFLSLFNGN